MVHATVVSPYNHLWKIISHHITWLYFLLLRRISSFGISGENISMEKYIFLPVRLYPVGSPQIAVLAGTVGQVFSVQSWFSFWLRMLRYWADRPLRMELKAETNQYNKPSAGNTKPRPYDLHQTSQLVISRKIKHRVSFGSAYIYSTNMKWGHVWCLKKED